MERNQTENGTVTYKCILKL